MPPPRVLIDWVEKGIHHMRDQHAHHGKTPHQIDPGKSRGENGHCCLLLLGFPGPRNWKEIPLDTTEKNRVTYFQICF